MRLLCWCQICFNYYLASIRLSLHVYTNISTDEMTLGFYVCSRFYCYFFIIWKESTSRKIWFTHKTGAVKSLISASASMVKFTDFNSRFFSDFWCETSEVFAKKIKYLKKYQRIWICRILTFIYEKLAEHVILEFRQIRAPLNPFQINHSDEAQLMSLRRIDVFPSTYIVIVIRFDREQYLK